MLILASYNSKLIIVNYYSKLVSFRLETTAMDSSPEGWFLPRTVLGTVLADPAIAETLIVGLWVDENPMGSVVDKLPKNILK